MNAGDRVALTVTLGCWVVDPADPLAPAVPRQVPSGTVGTVRDGAGGWFAFDFVDTDGVTRRVPRIWPEQVVPA